MAHRVRKAVFPVAGLGTRLLPATKTIPKEMVTIVDRPLIQYAVDEAREAGIEKLIFVTGRGKSALVDYFDHAFELEATMRERGKSLDVLAPSNAKFGEVTTVRQQKPLGLGHAVWCARDIIGDEPFAVLLPDDLMAGTPGALKQMVDAWEKVGGNLLATEEVPAEKTSVLRGHRPWRDNRRAHRSSRPRRKTRSCRSPVAPRRHRPLHPSAAGDEGARRPGARRGRRDPAHRRDGQADRQAAVPCLESRCGALRLRRSRGVRHRQSGDGAGAG